MPNAQTTAEEPLPCNCTETDIEEGTCNCADIMPPDDANQTMGCIVKKIRECSCGRPMDENYINQDPLA
jgi:hypothetical protein